MGKVYVKWWSCSECKGLFMEDVRNVVNYKPYSVARIGFCPFCNKHQVIYQTPLSQIKKRGLSKP